MMLAAIETFWFAVIWVALVLYFGLAVAVIVGGASDIKRLFQALRKEPDTIHNRDRTDPPSPG
jgi:hypothetical protein